jgi:peptidoglycan/LPS O-acetylase OafA/YrhL
MASVMLVIEPLENKNRLGLLDVAAVAATAWALAWLTIVAPLANRPLVRVLGQAVRRVLTWPFLTLLGRHSLLVYAWHVVLIYALEATSRSAFPVGEPYRSLEALAVIAALAIPAVVSERRARPRLRPLPA